ncbi:MAG: hypothetical protein OXG62_00635 [Nitrospinae bacterium]|nr:hypothetical protein [Nitrospinota bacterium]
MNQPQEFLLSLLKSKEGHKITGKKRVHKTIQLMKYSKVEIEADFRILHYGPYSYEVADAIEELVVLGKVTEKEEPILNFFQSTFSLHDELSGVDDLGERERKLFEVIDARPTLILEVASTIAFYEDEEGCSREEAIDKTKYLKPTKTEDSVLSKAKELLEELNKT